MKMRLGLINQQTRLLTRALNAQQGHEGFLARRRILAQCLARQIGVTAASPATATPIFGNGNSKGGTGGSTGG